MRTVALACLAVMATACTTATAPTSDPAAVSTTLSTRSAPPSTTASPAGLAPTTSAPSASTTAIAPTTTLPTSPCDPTPLSTPISADLDGDAVVDLVRFDPSESDLIVCTAEGTYTALAGGMGEVLEAVDLDGDGIDEILAGGTAAWGAGADVYRLIDGTLAAVILPDGTPLSLWVGLPPPDGFLAYGCADFDDSGDIEIAVVEGTVDGSTARWTRKLYDLVEFKAVEWSRDRGTFDASGAPDILSHPTLGEITGTDC